MDKLQEMQEVWEKVNMKLTEHQIPVITPTIEDSGEEVCGGLVELLLLFRDKEAWFLCRNDNGDPDKQIILTVLISSIVPDLIVGTKYSFDGEEIVWDTPS